VGNIPSLPRTPRCYWSSTIFTLPARDDGLVPLPFCFLLRWLQLWLFLPQEARVQPGRRAPAPAPRGDAHASLAAFPVPLLVAVGLALGALGAVAGSRGLGGDGPQQVIPLAQELGLAGQPEAAFPQRHARGVLGGARAVVVLQLGQVGCIPLRDELRDKGDESHRIPAW